MSGVYVALDLEATGMDPERDEIIEVAAIKFRDDRVLDRWESLVRPRGAISLNISSLTGIGSKDVRRAPLFASVAPRLSDFVRNHPIIGQSPQFDIEMLAGAGLRLQNPLYDTFQLATILIPDLPAYNLSTIAARLGISVPQQHRAMADVETTMAVFLGLLDIIRGHDRSTLRRLADYARAARSPLALLFGQIEREIAREEESGLGSSIAEQLLAKVGGAGQGSEMMFLFVRERPPRLQPTGSVVSFNTQRFEQWAAPGGALDRAFAGYESRPQQVQMMAAVMEAFNSGESLIVEAGTGTGKSVAYLLPAILHATEHGEPVVISTNTIALQDQLFRKDLPDLRRALQAMAREDPTLQDAADFEATLLKGRSNYLCLRRWFMVQREPVKTIEEATLYAKVLTWVQQTETGDRAELHLSPDEHGAWSRLAEEEGSCIPGRCIFHRRNQCFLFRARHKAESAHVVVVNHALLLSDMLAANRVLPAYRHLIVDEAHNLEDEATHQLGFRFSRGRVLEFLQRAIGGDGSATGNGALDAVARAVAQAPSAAAIEWARDFQPRLEASREIGTRGRELVELFFQQLGNFVERYNEERSDHDRRVRLTEAVRHDPAWSEVEVVWEDVSIALRELAKVLHWTASELDTLSKHDLPDASDLLTELDLLIRMGNELLAHGLTAVSEPAADTIYWIARRAGTGDVWIQTAPLNVGEALREHLFGRCRTVVLTSATLTTEGSFDYVEDRLGIDGTNHLSVPSPFDYRRSALVYLANDIPEPGQAGYQRALHETLTELCRATRGRAMVLFTSHSAVQSAYRAIKRHLEAEGILVLAQRIDGSPRQLVDRLRGHPQTVLLGTNSFWEGVDIVGESLSLLVICKLPFSVPTDPVFAARSEAFDDPFFEYALPQAVLRFKQGFGRLIRSANDRGVCAVLDRRIVSKRYGSSFVQSLPDVKVEVGPAANLPDRAGEWLNPTAGEVHSTGIDLGEGQRRRQGDVGGDRS